MRIGFLTDMLVSDPHSGMGNYARNLVREWSREHEVWSIGYGGRAPSAEFAGHIQVPRLVRYLDPIISSTGIPYSKWGWRREIERGTDVVHCPVQHVPAYFYSLDKPRVVTIHGAAPFIFERTGLTRPPYAALFRLRRQQESIDFFITVSRSAQKEITEHYGIPGQWIVPIYHGIDAAAFFPPDDKAAARKRACARFALPGPYVLHVSNYQPKKNGVRIVAAYRRLCELGFGTFALVLAGGTYHGFEAVEEEIRRRGEGQIIRLDALHGSELRELYQGAEVFLFPSLHETFGLPAVESMACGVPVVVSTVFSLPEITGAAAVQVNPSSVEEIADGVAKLLSDQVFYDHCRRTGLARSQEFRWSACAQEHLEAFQKATRRATLREKITQLNVGTYEPRSYWGQRAELYELDPFRAVCRLEGSREYNQRMHEIQRQRLLPLAENLLSGPQAQVLEVGCGVGRWAKELETMDVAYTGIDLSHEMLGLAHNQSPRCWFVQSSGMALPFAPDTFDLTLTVTVLHHMPPTEQETAVHELARVTRTGGHIVTLEDIVQPRRAFHMFTHSPEEWVALFERVGCRCMQTIPLRYMGERREQALIFVYSKRSGE